MSEAFDLYNQRHYIFSLDEAIEHAREAAERLARRAASGEMCEKCAVEHYTLYRWLVELRERRAMMSCRLIIGRLKSWRGDNKANEQSRRIV